MPKSGPYNEPSLPYTNDYGPQSRICNIDNVYVVNRKDFCYISFDNGLSWEKSETSSHWTGATANNSIFMPAFVYKDKFYIGSGQYIYRTDKSLDQKETFAKTIDIGWADSDGDYIYGSSGNKVNAYDENGTIHYSTECSSPYVVQCFKGIKGCFAFEGNNGVSYIVEGNKKHSSYVIDNHPSRIKAFDNYVVLDNGNEYYIYDTENDIQKEIKIYTRNSLISYDYSNKKFILIDFYGEIANSNNSETILYEYDFDSGILSEQSRPTSIRGSYTLCAPDYCLFYLSAGPKGAGLYDIGLNFIGSAEQPTDSPLLGIYRFEHGGKNYDYYMSSKGSIQLIKNDNQIEGEHIYIGNDVERTITNNNFGVAVADINSGFDFQTLLVWLFTTDFNDQNIIDFASECKIYKMRESLTANDTVYSLNFDSIYDDKMVIEYTDGKSGIKFIDKFKIIQSYNISKKPLIEGHTVKSIDQIEFIKSSFCDEKGNKVKHAVIFNFE
jgi:hypothetical protein